jgi:hypothetical protein
MAKREEYLALMANMDKAWEDLKESTEKLTNLHKK